MTNAKTRPYRIYHLDKKLEKDIYSVQEVAELLKAHDHTIRNAIKSNRLKAEKMGNIYYIKKDELERFLEIYK